MAILSTSLSLQNMRWRGVKDGVAINEGGIHLESLSYGLSIMRTSFTIGKSAAGQELITRGGNKEKGRRKRPFPGQTRRPRAEMVVTDITAAPSTDVMELITRPGKWDVVLL